MDHFRYGERVEVADPGHHFYRRRGTVLQVRARDGAARVRIERGIPPEQWLILEGETFPDETLLYPGHCERVNR